jgi:ABC-2 type transport system ATP-binding protein
MAALVLPTRLVGAELALETRGVVKRFGPGTPALTGLDLQVPAGAVYLLTGPHGAGKTTALWVLLDLVRADRGTVRVLGTETTSNPALVRARVGYVPASAETDFGWLTVEKFLRQHVAFFKDWDWSYAERLCRRLDIPLRAQMRGLSKGDSWSVMLVTALAYRHPVLLLDEPSNALDPPAREKLFAVLVEHRTASPTTLLWATHHVHEAGCLADHVGVLREGKLLFQGPRGELHLRRYCAQVPEGWVGAPGLNGEVLLREGRHGEIAWTVWGEEDQVVGKLAAAGATVREAAPLSLEDATVALVRAGRTG